MTADKRMTVGYRRVSSTDQNTVRQLDGVECDRVYEDKCSGKDMNRPELKRALDVLRDGDTLVVHSMDRLARNMDDLRSIVKQLTAQGITVRFMKESLTFTGESNHISNLMLSILGAIAQFEREMIRERQMEGVAKAKAEGKYKGRSKALTSEQEAEIRSRVAQRESKADLAREYGVSRQTIYAAIDGFLRGAANALP